MGRPSDQPGTPDPIPVPASPIAAHFPGGTLGFLGGVIRGDPGAGDYPPLLGAVDSPFFSFSIFFQIASYGTGFTLFDFENEAGSGTVEAFVDSLGVWVIQVQSSTGTIFGLRFDGLGQEMPIGVPVCLQCAIDTNHAAGAKIGNVTLNGVAQTPNTIFDAGGAFDIPFASALNFWSLGSSTPGTGDFFIGDATEWWIAPAQFVDFVGLATAFRTVGGKAVNIGGDGSGPTGTAPLMYFWGDASQFPTNNGPGGAFVEHSTLTNSTVNFY